MSGFAQLCSHVDWCLLAEDCIALRGSCSTVPMDAGVALVMTENIVVLSSFYVILCDVMSVMSCVHPLSADR